MLYILVDYSNAVKEASSLEPSLDYFIRSLLPHWQNANIEVRECIVRLYDGWDEQTRIVDAATGDVTLQSCLSRNAQEVARVVNRCYPKRFQGITVYVEMARSILAATRMVLPFTLRKKQEFHRLELARKEQFCCESSRNHYEYLSEYVKKRRCCHCKKKDPILYITEQKLVDTMIVSDMLFLKDKTNFIAVASDDDDMLPGVIQFVMSGGTVCHIRKRSDQLSYLKYCDIFRSTYVDFSRYHVVV